MPLSTDLERKKLKMNHCQMQNIFRCLQHCGWHEKFTGADDVNIDKDGAGELFQFYLDWYLLSFFVFTNFLIQFIAFFLQRHLQMIFIILYFSYMTIQQRRQLCFPSL